MKKIIFTCMMILCIGLLSGCSHKTDVDVSTVFIEKSGSVISVDTDVLDKDYYSAEELESYIKEQVEDYTAANGETVEMTSFDVEDNWARLKLEYDSYEDYAKFNGIELFVGTVVTAQAEGYDFDTEFYDVSADEEEGNAKTLSKDEVLADDDSKVAVIRANVNVQVPGTILYVSASNVKTESKDTVSITGEGANEEAELTYIIYK